MFGFFGISRVPAPRSLLNLDIFFDPQNKKTSSPSFASLQGLPAGRPLRAIELGSGVSALPCLVAARLRRRRTRRAGRGENGEDNEEDVDDRQAPSSSSPPLPLFSEIFATDIDECLPGLEANAVKNAPATTSVQVVKWEEGAEGEGREEEEDKAETKGDDDVGEGHEEGEENPRQTLKLLDLDWRLFAKAASSFLRAPFDVVLVADAVYIPELMPALVAAMRSVSSQESIVLLAYFLRSESAHKRFWPRLRAAFEVEHQPAASFGCAGADRGEGDDSRGLFRLRKRSESEYEELEEKRRQAEEEEEEGEQEEEEEGKK